MPDLEKNISKLKMMEISFEQINNSRNDLIKQLAEQEQLNEKLQKRIKDKIENIPHHCCQECDGQIDLLKSLLGGNNA